VSKDETQRVGFDEYETVGFPSSIHPTSWT